MVKGLFDVNISFRVGLRRVWRDLWVDLTSTIPRPGPPPSSEAHVPITSLEPDDTPFIETGGGSPMLRICYPRDLSDLPHVTACMALASHELSHDVLTLPATLRHDCDPDRAIEFDFKAAKHSGLLPVATWSCPRPDWMISDRLVYGPPRDPNHLLMKSKEIQG